MIFINQEGNNIKIQCEKCNKTLNFHKSDFHAITEKYCLPNKELLCDNCGESTKKTIYIKEPNSLSIKCPKYCWTIRVEQERKSLYELFA